MLVSVVGITMPVMRVFINAPSGRATRPEGMVKAVRSVFAKA